MKTANLDQLLLGASLERKQAFLHLVFIFFLFSIPMFLINIPLKSPFIFYKKIFLSLYFPFVYLINVSVFAHFFLRKKAIRSYFLIALGLIMISILINYGLNHFLLLTFPDQPPFFMKLGFLKSYTIAVPCIFTMTCGTSIETAFHSVLQERKRQEAENEKTRAELFFLKSQVSPHFLFNTLSNIHSLASDKSDDTEAVILKLSHLLRYMLYESNVDRIALHKEVDYLKNYIELQKMRLPKSRHIEIEFEIEGAIEGIEIEPMLFIPFVENAFKYGVSYRKKSLIQVHLRVLEDVILFQVFNYKMNQKITSLEDSTGIGLTNIKRRLNLLYPEKHQLEIQETAESYDISLTLALI